MVGAMCHENFYVAGTWSQESEGIYAGWTAREGSLAEQMPVYNERGDIALVFSGEDYPDPREISRLREHGHQFAPQGPSYLVHQYEDDPSFPAGLNGKFHGLLVDSARQLALLFNDRYGMHRIYYHSGEDGFYFAAEPKAILAVHPELRRIDLQSLGEFVSTSAILENRSLFEGIRALPPGSCWTFRHRRLMQKHLYFAPADWEEQGELGFESAYRELSDAFLANSPRYFAGPERIAMSLTGGLDTRMVVAAGRRPAGTLPCYTFGSPLRDNQDVRVARRIARACGQSHEVITAGPAFLSSFSHYAERAVYLTDGTVDVSRAPDLYLNEIARQIAPVRMTGMYGGEILRGICAFKPVHPAEGLYSAEFLPYIHAAVDVYRESVAGHPVSFAAFRQGPWYLHGVLALEQTQLSMRSPFLDNNFVRSVFRLPFGALASNDVSLRLIAEGNRDLLRIPTDRGLAGDRGEIVRSVARTVHEFSFKAEYAYDMGMPQWLARVDHTFSWLRLERAFLGRHKPFHFRVWYRDALAGYLQEMLLDDRSLSRWYVNRRGLEAVVRGHIRGDRNCTNEIHKVLTLELIQRLFVDSPLHDRERVYEDHALSRSA